MLYAHLEFGYGIDGLWSEPKISFVLIISMTKTSKKTLISCLQGKVKQIVEVNWLKIESIKVKLNKFSKLSVYLITSKILSRLLT